jgi:hypothetical protein
MRWLSYRRAKREERRADPRFSRLALRHLVAYDAPIRIPTPSTITPPSTT